MLPREDIERELGQRRLVLSMRVKASIGLLLLFLVVGSLVSTDIPNAMQAVRSLMQDVSLTENESHTPEQETLPEAPGQGDLEQNEEPTQEQEEIPQEQEEEPIQEDNEIHFEDNYVNFHFSDLNPTKGLQL